MGLLNWLWPTQRKSAAETLAEARALLGQGKGREAVRACSRVRGRDRTAAVLAEMAQVCLDAAAPHVALHYASEALSQDPNCAGGVWVQGEVLLGEGRRFEARDRFAKVLRLDPSSDRARRRLEELAPTRPPVKPDPDDGAEEIRIRSRLHELAGTIVKLRDEGRRGDAVPLARQAVSLALSRLGEGDLDTATSLNNLGVLLQEAGELTEARGILSRALAIREQELAPPHPDIATSLSDLGVLLHEMGDLPAACVCLKRSVAMQETLDPAHLLTALARHNLGILLQDMGDLTGARDCLERALAIQEAIGPNRPETARALGALGALLRKAGDLGPARSRLERAVAISERTWGRTHLETARNLGVLAGLLRETGDLAGAFNHLERVVAIHLEVFGPDHHHTATALGAMGALLGQMGDLEGARDHAERALQISRAALGPDHPNTAVAVGNLGGVLRAARDWEAARAHFQEALAAARGLGPDHPRTALALHNLGGLLLDLGEWGSAEKHLAEAVAVRRKTLGPAHPDTAVSLIHLALANVALGRTDEALGLMQEAAAADDRTIGQVFSSASETQRAGLLREMQRNTNLFLFMVAGPLRGSPDAIREAVGLVLRRKALSAEALAVQREAVLGGRYPALRPLLQEWAELRSKAASLALAGPSAEGWQAHRRKLDDWEHEQKRLESELTRQIPEMNLEMGLRTADRRAVARSLPQGSCLVEFVRAEALGFLDVPAGGQAGWKQDHYLAFVLHAGAPDDVRLEDLGEAKPIDRLIAAFLGTVAVAQEGVARPPRPPEAPEDAGGALRAAVFDRIAPLLGGCSRLLLSPDGDLNGLPFETLPLPDGRLLIDEYRVSYLSCGRDALRFSAAPGGAGEPVVVADPAFNLTAEGGGRASGPRAPRRWWRDVRFGPLDDSRDEGEAVAALLGVEPWLGADALEARVKGLQSPRVLHLSTHGYFLPQWPSGSDEELIEAMVIQSGVSTRIRIPDPGPANPLLRSWLALAGANVALRGGAVPPEAEDGILTAEDVCGMDLLGTELVVLSACDSGVGDVQVGEGVFGLRRAFVLAGAKRLVMSLWKVPDQQTRELMIDFYRRVLKGQWVAEALRGAQLELRKRYPEPYFWGAFICQGHPGPLAVHPVGAARTPQ